MKSYALDGAIIPVVEKPLFWLRVWRKVQLYLQKGFLVVGKIVA